MTSTTDYASVRQAWIDAANSLHPTDVSFANAVKAAWDAVGVAGNPLVSLATADESFESNLSLPSGYTTSLLAGTGVLWSVTTATGATGSQSLVSGAIGNNSASEVTWS